MASVIYLIDGKRVTKEEALRRIPNLGLIELPQERSAVEVLDDRLTWVGPIVYAIIVFWLASWLGWWLSGVLLMMGDY